MAGLGTALNVAAILVGSSAGMLGRRALPERMSSAVLQVMGLFTAVLGLRMLWPGTAMLSALISLVLGTMIGEALRLEERLEGAGRLLVSDGAHGGYRGFIAATLLFCVGPLSILGSLADGAGADYNILTTKAMLDGVASIPLAATMGGGVMLASVPVLVYQGLLTLGASFLQPWLQGPLLDGLNTIGGFLVLAIGLNISEIKRFRVANMLPALVVQVVLILLGLKI